MQTVFLKDGTKANLITKTDNGYVVDPLQVYHEYDTHEEYEEPSGSLLLVDKVYETAPKDVIEEDYRQLLQTVVGQEKALIEKRAELNRLKYEMSQLESAKTDLAKMYINRKELVDAKRLVIWIKGRIPPRIMDVKNNLKLVISYTISRYESQEQCWSYGLWSDYASEKSWSSYSEYYDPEYGIKTDLTDEEILKITYDRQEKNKYDLMEIGRTNEKWLTAANIIKRQEYIEKSNEIILRQAENELAEAQKKVNKLKNELTVS